MKGVQDDTSGSGRRSWLSVVKALLTHGLVVFLGLLAIEYLVIPLLVGASKNLDLLSRISVGWLVAGTVLEAASLLCYALLTRTLLLGARPAFSRLVRIVLATTAVDKVVPGGLLPALALGTNCSLRTVSRAPMQVSFWRPRRLSRPSCSMSCCGYRS